MDKYDRAISILMEQPEAIESAWAYPHDFPAGCLFQFATPSGHAETRPDGNPCGCITSIRSIVVRAFGWTDEITNGIRADNRIGDLGTHSRRFRGEKLAMFLQACAYWQRRLDREIRGIIDPEAPVEVKAVEPAPVDVIRSSWCGTANVEAYPVATTTTEDVRELASV